MRGGLSEKTGVMLGVGWGRVMLQWTGIPSSGEEWK